MHIPHIFELPFVKNSETLSDVFYELYSYILANPETVTQKYDGINISFKIMDNKIVLLTKNNQILNFEETKNRNIKEIYKTFYKELNEVFLKSPGCFLRLNLDEPDIFCSCEYISNKTNVIDYEKECFIVHGIFKYKSRKEPIEKIKVSKMLLDELVNNARKNESKNLTLTTLAAHPTTIKPLWYVGKKMTFPSIVEGGEDPTLEQLIELGQNPVEKFLKKQIYVDFINVGKVIEEDGFYDSIILLFLNMKLGEQLLEKIQFEDNHDLIEGIVIEGFRGIPLCKVTGNFYLDTFVQKNKFNSYYFSICGMKPPHKGHYHFINESLKKAKKYNSDLTIIIGEKKREGFSLEQTKQILSIYFQDKKELVFKFCEDTTKELYSFVINLPKDSNLYFCHGENEEKLFLDIKKLIKGFREDIQVFSEEIKILEHYYQKISSTDMRKCILNNVYEKFLEYIPEHCKQYSETIWNILKSKNNSSFNSKPLGIFIG